MNIITQTNDIVRAAIAAVRIERNPVTMGMLYDALTKRRNARDYVMPEKERMAWDYMERNCHYSDLSFREKVEFVKRFAYGN